MVEAKVKWTGGLKFEGISSFGIPITTDGSKQAGGNESGYKPTELAMFGLAGCTGIDIVKILEKMRQELTGLEIEIKAFLPDEYPKPFKKIEVKYMLTGKNLDKTKVERAISLSEEKYCTVSLSLKGMAQITSSYEIKEG